MSKNFLILKADKNTIIFGVLLSLEITEGSRVVILQLLVE